MEVEAFRKLHPAEFYRKFLVHAVRPDGRALLRPRRTTVTSGSVGTACGSSFVKVGNTSVTAGIKAECGFVVSRTAGSSTQTALSTGEADAATSGSSGALPSAEDDHPSQIVVNVELTPLCSPTFKTGKPSDQAQYLATTLNRLVRTTNLVDESALLLESRDKDIKLRKQMAWYLYVDLYCLDYDGNVFDACLIALIAALANVRLPRAYVFEKDSALTVVTSGEPVHSLTLRHYLVPLSFAIFDEVYVLADPTAEEETLAGSTFTIIYNDKKEICSVLKSGGTTLSDRTLRECMERAKARVDEVMPLLSPR